MIEIIPLSGIAEVMPGDDLPTILYDALERGGVGLCPGDILVVTQKIICKSEGLFVSLSEIVPGEEARRLARLTGTDGRNSRYAVVAVKDGG